MHLFRPFSIQSPNTEKSPIFSCAGSCRQPYVHPSCRNCSVINHFRFAAKSTGGREEDNALGRRRRRQERSGAANCGGIGKWSGADSEQVSFVPRTVKVSGFTRNNSEDGGKGKMETNGARERKQRKLERQFREGEAIPVGSEIDRARCVVGSLSLLLPSLEIN